MGNRRLAPPKPPNGGFRVRKELFVKIIENVSKNMSLSPL